MKALGQFLKFDINSFLADKKLIVTGVSELIDFNTKAHIGTKVETVIYEDKTPYKQKDGTQVSNRFEKLVLKINKDVTVPLNAVVVPVNAVASVYGDFRNQLSVKADDIQIVQSQQQTQTPIRKA